MGNARQEAGGEDELRVRRVVSAAVAEESGGARAGAFVLLQLAI